jgi:hypothetical protein
MARNANRITCGAGYPLRDPLENRRNRRAAHLALSNQSTKHRPLRDPRVFQPYLQPFHGFP